MKLGDMTFAESREAELKIAPIIEKIMSDSETSALCDTLFGANTGKLYSEMTTDEKREFVSKRVGASKDLTGRLIHAHYEDTCKVFAILNKTSAKEVEQWKRSDANEQIADMLNDPDLKSFFMSSEALAQEVLSVI